MCVSGSSFSENFSQESAIIFDKVLFFLSADPTKWSNTLTQTIRWQQLTNCLIVFENFVDWRLKG